MRSRSCICVSQNGLLIAQAGPELSILCPQPPEFLRLQFYHTRVYYILKHIKKTHKSQLLIGLNSGTSKKLGHLRFKPTC